MPGVLKLDDLEPEIRQRLNYQQHNMRQLDDLRRAEAEKVRLEQLQRKNNEYQRSDKRR